MPHPVHHTQLHLRLRVDRLDRFGEAFAPIHTGDVEVSHAAILQLRYD